MFIHFGGTGVMCFHTSLMKIPITYFEHPNMADVWVGKYCFENNIEVLSIAHTKDFLTYQPQKTTIFDSESNSDTIQTKIVNDLFNTNKPLPNMSKERDILIVNKLEKTPSTINYEKVNQIFNGQTHVGKTRQVNNNINERPTGNAQMIQKLMGKKRGR